MRSLHNWKIALVILMLAIVACTCGPLAGLTGDQEEPEEPDAAVIEEDAAVDEDAATDEDSTAEETDAGEDTSADTSETDLSAEDFPVYDTDDGYETEFVNVLEMNTPGTAEFTDIFLAHNWLFEGQAGQQVRIVVTGGTDETDTRAKLIDPSGELLAEEDDSSGLDPWIEMELPSSGIYTIRIDTWTEGSYSVIVSGEGGDMTGDTGSEDAAGDDDTADTGDDGAADTGDGSAGSTADPAALSSGPGVGEGSPPASGEDVEQWAIYAEASSELDTSPAMQATDANDTFDCNVEPTAWASASSSGKEWIRLGFSIPVIPKTIYTFQTYNPGAVYQIDVVNEDGNLVTIFEGDKAAPSFCPASIPFAVEDIDFPIAEIVIYIDQSAAGDWTQIDAVQLVGTAP